MQNIHGVVAAVFAATSTSKPSATGNIASILFIVVLFLLAYAFFIRPRSQQARRQRETLQELNVGDEILTGAGIFGRVLDVESDRITIETAPGTRITVLRSTVARRLTEPPEEETNWSDPDSSDSHDSTSELGSGHEEDEHHTWDEHEHDDESGGDAAAGGEAGRR